jgi:hypothetical protein
VRARVHERETRWDRRRNGRPPPAGIRQRRFADELTECGAEGAKAPEADSEADLGNGELRAPQELLRALDAAAQQVRVRRLAEGLLEAADEVRPRGVRLACKSGNVERLREVAVDQIFRTAEMDVDRDRVAHPPERLEQLLNMPAPCVPGRSTPSSPRAHAHTCEGPGIPPPRHDRRDGGLVRGGECSDVDLRDSTSDGETAGR